MDDTVLTQIEDGIGTITLNRPEKLNCINTIVLEVLMEKMETVLGNPEVKAVVLTGAGRAFCAGADVDEMEVRRSHAEWETIVERYLDPIRLIVETDKPVIASINGDAVGGGLGLAIASDMRVAVETARFCAPFIGIGLAGCDMSAGYFLPRLIGMGRATDMMMTGRFVLADEAERIGLVNRVVSADNLSEETTKLAQKLISFSAVAMTRTKRAIRRSIDRDMKSEFDYEVLAQIQCLQSQEHRAAVDAFKKRWEKPGQNKD